MPAWDRECRRPSFITDMTFGQDFRQKKFEEFSVGLSLYASCFSPRVELTFCRWGNTPATDVINLARNEKTETKDFSLAFIGTLAYISTFHSFSYTLSYP
jgi:hypothetical protein